MTSTSRGAIFLGLLAISIGLNAKATLAAPERSLEQLKARVTEETQILNAAYASVAEIPMYKISGEVSKQNTNAVLVYGKAFGTMGVSPSAPGWLTRADNILINYREPKNITYQTYQGEHYYLGTKSLPTIFGGLTDVKVYGRPPQTYYQRQAKVDQANKNLTVLGNLTVKAFRAKYDGELQGKNDDRAAFYEYGQQALELSDFLGKSNLDSSDILRQAAVQYTRAATQDAKAGKFPQAIALLDKVFEIEQPNNSTIFQTGRYRMTETEKNRLPRTTGKEPGPMGTFPYSDVTTDVYEKRPDIYNALLKAWSDALPAYLSQASEEEKDAAVGFSVLLVINAPKPSVSYAGKVNTIVVAQRFYDVSAVKQDGRVQKFAPSPYLGVQLDDPPNGTGALIKGFNEEFSPAKDAGLMVDDIIVSIDERPLRDVEELLDVIAERIGGTPTFLKISRKGKEMTLKVFFGQKF